MSKYREQAIADVAAMMGTSIDTALVRCWIDNIDNPALESSNRWVAQYALKAERVLELEDALLGLLDDCGQIECQKCRTDRNAARALLS